MNLDAALNQLYQEINSLIVSLYNFKSIFFFDHLFKLRTYQLNMNPIIGNDERT